nr:26S proteasome regulatory subunit 6B homolog [Tanacetum cinerariifolium]
MAATMVLYPNSSLSSPLSKDDDDYTVRKKLEHSNDFLDIQQDYVKEEQKNLKHEVLRWQEDGKRIQSVPLEIGQFLEIIDENYGIVASTNGHNYYVKVSSTVNREMLKPSASVALHKHSHALVDVLPPEADSGVSLLSQSEKPDVTYNDIGGCDIQKQEITEAVELPLTHHELYKQIGIDPPRGVLLYGPPGTGKTMLAKAVANHTTAAFIRVVGSEFVQKYLGEGPRMVRDVFRLAKENAPAIILIDEVDAIATARFDAQTGSDREVQRILMELLNQMDGFDQTVNVKRLVFQVCTAKMNLSDEVDLEDYVSRLDKISAAEISAICQEAGMHAVRKNRYVILPKDLEKGYRTNVKKPDTDFDFYKLDHVLHLFNLLKFLCKKGINFKLFGVLESSTQLEDVNVDETISPDVKPGTIRTVLSLVVSRHWLIHWLDVKNAFLQRSLCDVNPSIDERVDLFLEAQDRMRKKGHKMDTTYLLLYVDDIVLTASSQPLLQRIIASLHQEFSITDLGSLNYFLGIFVTRDSSRMFVSQRKYVVEILEKAHMVNCNSSRTRVDTESKLGDDDDPVSDLTLYRSLTDLVAYSDADWAGCPTARRSIS